MIYFDNGATTFPKPKAVEEAVLSAMRRYGANPGRSGHTLSMQTAMKVYGCREAAAELFHAAEVEDVVFTCNCTHALNTVFHGVLGQGDHVIISDLEHNSVLRPVHCLSQKGIITYDVAQVSGNDAETVGAFERLIRPETKLIACTHGSNVFGLRLPIRQIGEMARRKGVLFLVDAAQTAGVVNIDMQQCGIDFLCMAGHKSLYGPSGTGLLITPLGNVLEPLMAGGTGSMSSDYGQPLDMPDHLESGTVNTMGIIGLDAGIRFVQEHGIEKIYRHEMKLGEQIYASLSKMGHVRLYTPDFKQGTHLPVISFNVEGMPSEEAASRLSDLGFALRGGLHCAPLAHQKMGTMETGAVRISIGAFNTPEQAKRLCGAVARLGTRAAAEKRG